MAIHVYLKSKFLRAWNNPSSFQVQFVPTTPEILRIPYRRFEKATKVTKNLKKENVSFGLNFFMCNIFLNLGSVDGLIGTQKLLK